MDLNHFLRHFQRRRRQRRQPAIARPTAICAPSPPGGPASGAHRSEGGGRSDGRRSTCPRALGRGGLWRARERWRRWPRPAGRTPRSACRAPPPFGPVGPRQKEVGGSFRVCQILIGEVSGQVFVEFDLPSGRLPWLSENSGCLVVGSAAWVGTRLAVTTAAAQSGVAVNSQGTDSEER